ncbi:hypothetical protein [Sphingomicrobium astaxanthinifaciens]|uniref:hypothetical protein n=1 Tax=Sphingomicrobium astaxanthinifaciens TaxID=1227949 RepID=UPI001FCC8DCA|nr:hypothetical protein [Sphingomicrobium astaxanthinifaciens]MCJ7421877.1 hypothetical protein [Sphingomicrobium astaxanthinifaciens]
MTQAKDEPSKELEEQLRRHPDDAQLKVDVGSDESMDASDPISVTRCGDDEPHPNSNAPRDKQ